jgi:uncharacterized protein
LPTAEIREVIFGYGHKNIQAMHKTTLEFTKDLHLSKKGDCIIVVATDKALTDLGSEFKENMRKPNAKLAITIEADGISEQVNAEGSPHLILTHPTDMVIRKSGYLCSRTLAVHADKAACDLSRNLMEILKNPEQEVKVTLTMRIY